MFVDIALKAVGIQLVYAAIVVGATTLVSKIVERKKSEKYKEEMTENE